MSTEQTLHPSVQIIEECEWSISPPPHKILKLKVDTSKIKDGKPIILSTLLLFILVSCSVWSLRIWSSSKDFPLQQESIDWMCGEDNRREYSIPEIFRKVIHIRYELNFLVTILLFIYYRVSSVHSHQLSYSLEWKSTFPLQIPTFHAESTDPPVRYQAAPTETASGGKLNIPRSIFTAVSILFGLRIYVKCELFIKLL